MNDVVRRSRLLPWYIGLVLVVAAVGYVAYYMYANGCTITPTEVFLVLFAVPVVYLGLMYLTFKSQR